MGRDHAAAGARAPDFTPAEARHVASLGRTLTEGLRIGIALGLVPVDCTPNGPGMLIVDDDLKILTMTSNAERWLEELTDGCPGLPDAVRSVVGYVRQLHGSSTPENRMPRARVRGTTGRWLAIYASRPRDQLGVREHRRDHPGSQAIGDRATHHPRLRSVTA